MLEYAKKYHSAGLKVIPFWKKTDGKVSFPSNWAQYRDNQTEQDIERLFSGNIDGIAMLCTDDIEVIDIDVKHDPDGAIGRNYFADLMEYETTEKAIKKCVVQKTKSNGWHVIYKAINSEGNQKLAFLPGCKEAAIETRGDGGLLFVYPSPGYEVKRGDLCAIREIAPGERKSLINAARLYDSTKSADTNFSDSAPGDRPGDIYNEKTNLLQLLEKYGWTKINERGDFIRLNRPGAKHKRGIDATIIKSRNKFYPWSSSTPFDVNRSYDSFSVFAVMECNGDYKEAAKKLSPDMAGEFRKAGAPAAMPPKNKTDLVAKARETKFDYHEEIKEDEIVFKMTDGEDVYNIAGYGQIGVFTGAEKSGKSFVTSQVAASVLLSGFYKLNLALDAGSRKTVWFDTEQSRYWYQRTQKRIHENGAVYDNTDRYEAFHLRKFSPEERLAIIEEMIYTGGDIGVVVIDGYVDLMNDYNSLEESQALMSKLLKWTDEKNILMMGVLHVNKGDGKIRGHLGSELKNKADFIINVRQPEPNLYEVSNPTSRYISFPTLTFNRNSFGEAENIEAERRAINAPF